MPSLEEIAPGLSGEVLAKVAKFLSSFPDTYVNCSCGAFLVATQIRQWHDPVAFAMMIEVAVSCDSEVCGYKALYTFRYTEIMFLDFGTKADVTPVKVKVVRKPLVSEPTSFSELMEEITDGDD